MTIIKKCLHNKKGLDQKPGDSIKLHGEGNCYECDYDVEDNKNCRKFFPVTKFGVFDVIKDK